MDPISIFSLFCNVLTVVDVAVKTTKSLKQLYDSPSGSSKFNERIGDEMNRLNEIANELSDTNSQLVAASAQRPLVEKVALECTRLAEQIWAILDKCKVDPQSPKALAVLKAWANSKKHKSAFDELHAQFQVCADHLRTAMAAATLVDLNRIKETLSKIASGQEDVLDGLSSVGGQLSGQQATLSDMKRSLSLARNAQLLIRQGLIVRALRPLTMQSRESEVAAQYGKTLKWITDPETDAARLGTNMSFVDWLKAGTGVFHLSGKPGSGKSTLMKFLANDPSAARFLNEWANEHGKILVISKFFFWRHGSKEQKSVSGLLRGLLYEMCCGSSWLSQLLFPNILPEDDLVPFNRPELRIIDSQVREAFERISNDPEIGKEFALCFFIDGLDEFDGEEMAHWRLAKMIRAWSSPATNGVDLKLCVSSREDHAIVAAFENCHRVRLQYINHSDIRLLVEDSLSNNEYFEQLKRQDKTGRCERLVSRILEGADGVFLWVTLLLNLLEDELPSASSIEELYGIVETTPTGLDDYISNILDTIKKHHRRGAYLLLAMALRMMGFHLDDGTKFPPHENALCQSIFEYERDWRPHLPVYGLSVAVDALLSYPRSSIAGYREALAKYQVADYQAKSQEGAKMIQNWCRGLLEVVDDTDRLFGILRPEYRVTVAKFMHGSIPDHLMSVIRDKSISCGFNDQDIAEGITLAVIAESQTRYHDRGPLGGGNLAFFMQHLLRLLRLRPISPSSNIHPLLHDLERARFGAFLRAGGGITSSLPLGSHQTFSTGYGRPFFQPTSKDIQSTDKITLLLMWDRTGTVLAHASNAGLHEYVRWIFVVKRERSARGRRNLLFSAVCGLTAFYSSWWGEFPQSYSETLKVLLKAGASLKSPEALSYVITSRGEGRIRIDPEWHALEHATPYLSIPHQWPWISIIPSILDSILKSSPPLGVWEFLEACLSRSDASPPDKISCRVEEIPRSHRAKNTQPWYARFYTPVVRYEVILEDDNIQAHSLSEDGNTEGGAIVQSRVFSGCFNLNDGIRHQPIHVRSGHSRENHLEAQQASGGLARCLGDPLEIQTGGRPPIQVSLADLIRYHAPHNMDILLDHLEGRSVTATTELEKAPV